MGMVADWVKDGVIFLLDKAKGAMHGIVSQALATFGLSMVTINQALPNLKAFVLSNVGSLPGPVQQALGYLGVGEAISMILSALTVRLTWKVFIVPKSVADQMSGGQS